MHNWSYVELLNPFVILADSQNISIIIISIFILDFELLSHVLFVVFGIVFPRINRLPCFLQLLCSFCWDSCIEDVLALKLILELKRLLRDQLLKLNLFFRYGFRSIFKELIFLRSFNQESSILIIISSYFSMQTNSLPDARGEFESDLLIF